jgi:hypothetical protein
MIYPLNYAMERSVAAECLALVSAFMYPGSGNTVKRRGAFLSHVKEWFKKAMEPAVLIPAIGSIIIFGGVGAFLGHLIWPKHKAVNAAAVTITYPPDNSQIPRCVNVSGTAVLPAGDSVWLVVRSEGDRRYYQAGPAVTNPPDGIGNVTWSYNEMPVGSLGESGTGYEIYAVILGSDIGKYLDGMTIVTSSGITLPVLWAGGSADTLPPNLLAAKPVEVTRSPDPPAECRVRRL